LSYAEHDNSSNPVLAEDGNQDALDWGLPYLRGGILAAVDQLCRLAEELGISFAELGQSLKNPARQALLAFLDQPSAEEADAFGSFPFQFDQRHSQILEMAPRLSPLMACVFNVLGDHPFPFKVLWKEGTLARSLPLTLHRSAFALLRFSQSLSRKK
jgi:hypothetical protein